MRLKMNDTFSNFTGATGTVAQNALLLTRNKKPRHSRSPVEKYENQRARTEFLRSKGYVVTEIWECEFDKLKKENAAMSTFLKNNPLLEQEPLNPRDAFFGGRTGTSTCYYTVKDGEKISYTDICSLYPYICRIGKFPVGHFEVFIGEDCKKLMGDDYNNVLRVEGLVKCRADHHGPGSYIKSYSLHDFHELFIGDLLKNDRIVVDFHKKNSWINAN